MNFGLPIDTSSIFSSTGFVPVNANIAGNFGTPIDNRFLFTMVPEYKGRNESQITGYDRGKVAKQLIDTSKPEATRYLDQLRGEVNVDSNTPKVLCRIYNATGESISVHFSHSWSGSFMINKQPPTKFENGQWTAFMHIGSSNEADGSVIYRNTDGQTDFFIGWKKGRWGVDGKCYAEARGRDHWWSQGSSDYMLHLLNNAGNSRSENSNGYKISMTYLGDYCEAIIERG